MIFASRPYRANVGIALFNGEGLVMIARRLRNDGPEIILPGFEWQMPQGGIDAGEEPCRAARRELQEETGVTSVDYVGETADWLIYDFPPYDGPPHRLARFRGQRQKWFALLFTGGDCEIDLASTRGAAEPCRSNATSIGAWHWSLAAFLDAIVVRRN